MAAIASQLRNYKEPDKEQLTQLFFALPNADGHPPDASYANLESLDINAVFSLGAAGQEDSYVSALSDLRFYQSS
jgi:TBC1 domain family member 8/9